MNPAKAVEAIAMPFGMLTHVSPRNRVLDGGPKPYARRDNFEGERRPAQNMLGHV